MPINPFVFRRIGLDTGPISEGGMMSPFVVSGDRVNTGFDSNIFNYGTYKGGSSMGDGVTSLGGGMGGIGGGIVGGEEARIAEQARLLEEARLAEQARLDEEARLYFQQVEAAKQARLAEEAKLAEEARIAEEARLAEEARIAGSKTNTSTTSTAPTAPTTPTTLPPVVVNENRIPGAGGYIDQVNQNIYNLGLIGPANDPANLAANPNKYQDPATKTAVKPGDTPVTLPAITVTGEPVIKAPPITYPGPTLPVQGPTQTTGNASTPVILDPVKVKAEPLNLVPLKYTGPSQPFVGPLVNPGAPIKLEPVKADAGPLNLIPNTGPAQPFVGPIQYPGSTIKLEPAKKEVPPDTPTPVIPSVPVIPSGTGTTTGGAAGSSQGLTIKRDFGGELAETLAALQKNQPAIMSMYGDLYKQFMPKGITEAESGIIGQYKTDLERLQQRQAGVLAPEDVRQSQQAAREAYAARGQVMGPGAVGAEIMNREAIRQQREDQARAGLQASYGNVLNMANLQTGNIFSPIGNLMSNTFNPLSPYAADVYGTNVNAQLAKEIAQKNYDAAVRSAELSGAAMNKAATTSAAGSVLGPAIGGVVGKGLSAIFSLGALSCMPGNQCIDTPTGPKAIKDLKGGDSVIGYDGEVAFIAQACSWNQNPLRTFLTITRDDGSSFTVCDDHKIMGIPAMEWVEGAELSGSLIKSIKASTGLLTSYDILTNQGGYRINGIPVNSMIPEIVMQIVDFHRQVDRNLQVVST